MKRYNWIKQLTIIAITIFLTACGGGSIDSSSAVSGVAQKGPFLEGAIAKIFKLDTSYERTSQKMQVTVGANGSYRFSDIPWTGISEIEVSGRFLNEVTGDTAAEATITSIVEVKADGTVETNINVLTSMASGQIRQLLLGGMTLADAQQQVANDLMSLMNRTDLGINDFGDLDLGDLVGENATANSELLYFSAALLCSINYAQDLEALLNIYANGGVEALLGAPVYTRLMKNRSCAELNTLTTNLGIDYDTLVPADIVLPPMMQISKLADSDMLNIRLSSAKFNTLTPSFMLKVSGGSITAGTVVVSEDNRSATMQLSGDIDPCQDVNLSLMVDYNELIADNLVDPLWSNTINMHPETVICQSTNDGTGATPINLENKAPVAVIGYDMPAWGATQQAPQTITTAVGATVFGLDTYYSYDRDPYPLGGIVGCEWKDENGDVIKTSNDSECGIYDKVFTVPGTYVYTLTVRDNGGATNSNTVSIDVASNSVPVVTLNPSDAQSVIVGTTVEISAAATDADGDALTYQWMVGLKNGTTMNGRGNTANFSYQFNTAGIYMVELEVRDIHGAITKSSLEVAVTNPSDAPPVAKIDGSENSVAQEIYAGNAPYAMAEGTDDVGIEYCKWTDPDGTIVLEHTFSPAVTYLDYNRCLYNFPLLTEAGEYVYIFTVRDTAGQEDSNELNVTVLSNSVPVVDIGSNQTIEVNTTLNLTANATDADGDTMTYQWMYGLDIVHATMYGAGSATSFSHTFDTIGEYIVTLEVRDVHNATVTVQIEVNVTMPAGDPVGTVSVGDLMWEDTSHVKGVANHVTWTAADTYCADLDLGGHTDWRLPVATWDDVNGVWALNELRGIRIEATNDTNNTVMAGFAPILQSENIFSWIDHSYAAGEHTVGIFAYDIENFDGMGDDEEVNVRCVRDK